MTIYEIKERTRDTSPRFFTRATMRFFGQTLKMFTVRKLTDGRYRISAPMRDRDGRHMGESVRIFNPANNELEHEAKP